MIVGFVVALIALAGAFALTTRRLSLVAGVVVTAVGVVAAVAAVWTGVPLFYNGVVKPEAVVTVCVAVAIVVSLILDTFVRSTYTPPRRPAKLK